MSGNDNTILYLSEVDIAALDIDSGSVMIALEQAFRLHAAKKMQDVPKASIWLGPGHGFQNLSVVDTERGVAVSKWIGLVPPGSAAAANVNASILISDTSTGEICCFMDARRATALRTAGMSAASGKYLARMDSTEIGFIGAGVQAQSHLVAFGSLLPSLKTVRVHSAKAASAERFANFARTLGFAAEAVTADEILTDSDVIISTVPLSPGFEPFLDAAKTRAGVFIAAIDLARPWIDPSISALDMMVIDEEAFRHYSRPGTFIPPLTDADATLCDLVSGQHRGRTDGEQRVIFVSSGSAVADLAIGRLIYQQALAQGIGTSLPR